MAKQHKKRRGKGKKPVLRTWWHPLMIAVLRWLLSAQAKVREEVSVGSLPLRIDAVFFGGDNIPLSDEAKTILAGLVERFNYLNLLELKGPEDHLTAGDFRKFLAYAHLHCAQTEPLLDSSKLSLFVMAPSLTKAYQDELHACQAVAVPMGHGIWKIENAGYPMWVFETSLLFDQGHPFFALFSPEILKHPAELFHTFSEAGFAEFFIFVAQCVQQFAEQGATFAMKHTGTEHLDQFLKEFVKKVKVEYRLEGIPLEQRLAGVPPEQLLASVPTEQRLAGVSTEQRLAGVSPEQRLAGIPPEQLLAALSPEAKQKLAELLRKQNTGQ